MLEKNPTDGKGDTYLKFRPTGISPSNGYEFGFGSRLINIVCERRYNTLHCGGKNKAWTNFLLIKILDTNIFSKPVIRLGNTSIDLSLLQELLSNVCIIFCNWFLYLHKNIAAYVQRSESREHQYDVLTLTDPA